MSIEQIMEDKKIEEFKYLVKCWAVKIKVEPIQIRVQKMKNKWASCSDKGWISFNEQLLNKSLGFKEYVIVHELIHLKVPNHGKLFKSLMAIHYPNYQKFERKTNNLSV